VLAPGGIAGDFVSTVLANTDQQVVAVASRSAERAERFAMEHGIPRSYGAYQQLVDDPKVDIVYIAAPNSQHRPLALLAIAAGKHVLIEKPMAVDATQAREIADAARAAGVFAMEAMWSRFLPQTDVISQLLDGGDLGELRLVTADFGADFSGLRGAPVFDPVMGGGALRDIGIYPVWFARFVLGTPQRAQAFGQLTDTGVDGQAAMLLSHAGGAQALLHTTMFADTPTVASISGTRARIELRSPFLMPDGFAFIENDVRVEWTDDSGLRLRDGLAWQTTAIAQCVADGRTESALHTLQTSIGILETLDDLRGQIEEQGRL
jgi:predicted dehydrogenase